MSIPGRARGMSPSAIVALCFCVAALEGYDIQAFGIAAPRMAPALSLRPDQVGWAGSAAMVGLMIGAFVGGGAADRWGRRPVLAASVAAFGLFSALTALSTGFEALVLARLLTGLGFGGAMPNLIAIASEISPPNRRAATTTTMFCGLPAGGSLVAILAQAGGAGLDWGTLFLIGGAAPLLLAPLVALKLPETRPHHDPEADSRLWPALFGQGRFAPTLLLWLLTGLDLVVTYLLLNWLPTLVVAKGYSAAEGAASALWFNGFSIVGAIVLGRVADRIGYRIPVILMFVLLAAGLLGLAQAPSALAMLACAGVCGFFVVGGAYVLYAMAPDYYPHRLRALGAGAAVAVGRLGSIAGPALAGQLRSAGATPAEVIQSMIPAALAGALVAALLMAVGRPYAD